MVRMVCWWGNLRERECLEYLNVNGRIILKTFFKKKAWVIYWIDLAQDRDKWRAFVKTVMNLRVPFNRGRLLTR